MGKRKRLDTKSVEPADAVEPAKHAGHGRQERAGERPLAKNFDTTASATHVRRSGKMSMLDERDHENVNHEDPEEAQAERRKRKKHKKKKESHRHAEEASPSVAQAASDTAPAGQASSSRRFRDLDESLVPNGPGKHARRRWRRKLIRQGLLSKEDYRDPANARTPESRAPPQSGGREVPWSEKPIGRRALARQSLLSNDGHAQSSRAGETHTRASTKARDDVPWTEKPIGRKALARQLATTALMQPPSKRWEESLPPQPEAPMGPLMNWTTFQRSAMNDGKVVLPGSSAVGDSDAKSDDFDLTRQPGIPQLRISSHEASRFPPPRPTASLRESVSSSLLSGITARPLAKRHFFGSKANDVPTYSVSGDAAERFKRFSASAHAKEADDSDGSSSEASSKSGSSNSSRKEKGSRAPSAGAKRVETLREGNADMLSDSGDVALPQLDGLHDLPLAPALATAGKVDRMPNLPKFSEIVSRTDVARHKIGGSKRNIFGSEVGGSRSARDRTQDQESIAGEDQLSQAPLDDAAFDAHQAIEDVFSDVNKMTRDLPAGKSAPHDDIDREDDLLTRKSSPRRLTRSARKAQPTMNVDRHDSGIPDLGNNDFIVQSMQLPETPGPTGPSEGVDHLTEAATAERDAAINTTIPNAPAQTKSTLPRRSSSVLSELGHTPSPPHQPSNGRHSPLEIHAVPLEDGDAEDDDTIAVAVVEQSPEPRKKRKMTGRTSKHFSTPKLEPKKRSQVEDSGSRISSAASPQQEETRAGKQRKRLSRTEQLLAETKKLIADSKALVRGKADERPSKRPRQSSHRDVAEESGDERVRIPGESDAPHLHADPQMKSKRRKKERVRRSSSTFVDPDDGSMIERRSQNFIGAAKDDIAEEQLAGDGPSELHAEKDQLDNVGEEAKPRKRARPSGGKITDVDASNILGRRSRRSTDADRRDEGYHEHIASVDPEETVEQATYDARDEAQQSSSSNKRYRREGGRITDLDTSNIIGHRSRRSTDIGEGATNERGDEDTARPDNSPAQERDRETAEHGIADDPQVDADSKAKAKRRSRRSGGKITDIDDSNILGSRSRRQIALEDPTAVVRDNQDEDAPPSAKPVEEEVTTKPKAKRKTTGKRSIYFIPQKPPLDPEIIDRVDFFNTTAGNKKKRAPAGVSTAPVPPIHSDRFGIIQEKLWREPFWLLIAVTFLNKTTGRAAAPVFWKLKEKFVTPEALAEADQEELCEMVHHLGLQTQRSKRLIKMAKAWVEGEPVRGVRWRVLHYPEKGDGKEYQANVPVEEDADEIEGAIEIGRIPGCGPYAWDSWRIFCRDVLRGVAEDYNGANAEEEGFLPEWQKVVPDDKELRACLRWMWLREGWIWNHGDGSKRRATGEEMERAVKGEMEVADADEMKFAVRAAEQEATATADVGQDEMGEVEVNESGLSSAPPSEEAGLKRNEREARRKRKRAVTPEMEEEEDVSEDNIVVSSPAKKRRTSRRRAGAHA